MNKRLLTKLSVTLLGVTALVVAAFAFFFWKEYFWYDIGEFQGDGEISDHGFWSYPRYRFEFDEIDLLKSGEHKMTFKGVPPVALAFELLIPGTYSDGPLKDFNTVISVSIADDKGRIVCRVSARINDWTLARSFVKRYLWRAECTDISLSPRREYTLTISIDSTESPANSLPARPSLWGGGFET